MLPFAKSTIERNIGVLAVVFCILVGGTWAIVKLTSDYLLYQDAASTARDWARYLVDSTDDLEQIAAGEQPSAASMAFFRATQRSGAVFRYEIFNREGYSQLVSQRSEVELVDVSEFSADAARSITTGQPIIDVEEGHSKDLPGFFARAYVPVFVDNRPVAIVAAYVDETQERDNLYRAVLIAAASLCLLTGLSFMIPAVAWYRRTKEKQQADRRIRFLAQHDTLTGLANRASLIEALDRALVTLPLHGDTLAVHFIDVDRFKEVNDSFGHDSGDFVLKTVAERLLALVRIDDTVARLGGDEFVVVQRGHITKRDAEVFAGRIANALAAPVRFGEYEIVATVSIGVALTPADGTESNRLLKSADLALYKSKADGRNCVRFFLPEMDAALVARLTLERTIRDAVQNDRFVLHFQPIFEVCGQELTGFEALVRLPTPDGTLIPPGVFIPVAEEIRLIDKIGAWVMREACRTAATWPEHLTVAVNLSPAQFESGSFSELVAEILKETGLAPKRLELEITETLLLANSAAILQELQRLKEMGVAVVMDDFGTGYSSLSYLWRFPFNKIKIDRSFMQAFGASDHDAEIVVKTIIALGRELHMQVTVEGVETATQAAFLDQAAADQVQGFYFGRPMPAADIAAGLLKGLHRRLAKPLAATSHEDAPEAAKAAAES
ncbi:MAG: EAL domain-containing protein [Xanthobacteraceae bacterium]